MLKLLVVDDNNRDRRVAREMSIWQDLNIQLIGEAANGQLALEQIEHLGVPDIIITDVSMPYMDGITLSQKIQREYPRVHVLFMSYYEEFEYARNAISVHADAYIVKPLREKEVRAAVEKALEAIHDERSRLCERKNLQKRLEQAMPVLREDFMRSLMLEGEMNAEEIREQLEYFRLKPPQRCCVMVIRKHYKGLTDIGERYIERTHNTAQTCPTLMLHGEQDSVVFPFHSVKFHDLLNACNVETELDFIQDTNHAFLLAEYMQENHVSLQAAVTAAAQIDAWLDKQETKEEAGEG